MILVDLAEFLKIKEQFALETNTVGNLRVCPLSENGLQKLKNEYGHLKKATPIDVVRYFITIVAYLHNPEKKEISPDDKKISIKDSKKLSEAELNNFSERFIEYNEDYLLEKLEISETKISDSKAEIHREENEPPINYLSKLIINKINDYIREEEVFLKNLGISHPPNLLSNNLTMGILNSFEAQRKLYDSVLPFQKEIDNLQKYTDLIRDHNVFHKPSTSFEHLKLERPIDRIRETNDKLDVLIGYQSKMGPVIENSSNLLGKMNDVLAAMAADSNKVSRIIIWLNISIIIISLIALFSGIFIPWLNYKSSIEASKASEINMSLLIHENYKLNNNINQYQNNLNKIIDNQSKTIDLLNNKKSIKDKK